MSQHHHTKGLELLPLPVPFCNQGTGEATAMIPEKVFVSCKRKGSLYIPHSKAKEVNSKVIDWPSLKLKFQLLPGPYPHE